MQLQLAPPMSHIVTLRCLLLSSSCWLRYLFYSNSLFSTPHLLLTSLQPSQTAILTPFWTSAGHLLKTKTRISLWRPRALFKYHSGRAAHPHIHGYCYLGMVHVQSGHMRDKAISIRAQITDFSCQMQMLLLSQGKLRYFQMWMSGLNMGGFPKERAKDTFLPIPGYFFSKHKGATFAVANSYKSF